MNIENQTYSLEMGRSGSIIIVYQGFRYSQSDRGKRIDLHEGDNFEEVRYKNSTFYSQKGRPPKSCRAKLHLNAVYHISGSPTFTDLHMTGSHDSVCCIEPNENDKEILNKAILREEKANQKAISVIDSSFSNEIVIIPTIGNEDSTYPSLSVSASTINFQEKWRHINGKVNNEIFVLKYTNFKIENSTHTILILETHYRCDD